MSDKKQAIRGEVDGEINRKATTYFATKTL